MKATTTTLTDHIKLKKITAGIYIASATFNGSEYKVEASLLDDYKSFGWTYTKDGMYVDGDGWYGLRLKDIKNTTWSSVVESVKQP